MIKLDIGGGSIPKPGYINIDCIDHPMVHYKVDLNSGIFPFEDNSVDEIYSNHCLEHINPGYNGFLHCIEELWRISKPNAPWYIRVPYHNSHHTYANPFHTNNIFNEYTFYYFSDVAKQQPFSNTCVRKGSAMEYHLKATLIIDQINFEYFSNYSHLKDLPEQDQEIYRLGMPNVVNNIVYHMRAEKPDFWVKEIIRNSR